jgi:hypothetical protein
VGRRQTMLRQSGHHIAAEALQSVHTATTVRVRNGKMFVTDGPFTETKEQLAGFYLIDARDLNEAIQLAAKMPPARRQHRGAAGQGIVRLKEGSMRCEYPQKKATDLSNPPSPRSTSK